MKLITEEWLSKANEDLDVAREIIVKEYLTNMVAYNLTVHFARDAENAVVKNSQTGLTGF